MIYDHDVLLKRTVGGAGDILALRMIFRDFKRQHPGGRFVFAAPEHYWSLVSDHPDIDELVTPNQFCPGNYPISYDISTVCGAYEYHLAPKAMLSRSDIWAKACGIELTEHKMHIMVSEEEKAFARDLLGDKPTVAICPRSSTKARDLTPETRTKVAKQLLDRGYQVVMIHTEPVDMPDKVIQLTKLDTRQWFGVMNHVDAVVTAETSHSHLAGGLGKPTVQCYSVGDGYIYTKYYENSVVVQQHEFGTYNAFGGTDKITADRIMEAFDRLAIKEYTNE